MYQVAPCWMEADNIKFTLKSATRTGPDPHGLTDEITVELEPLGDELL